MEKKTRRLALIFANTFYDDDGEGGFFKNLSPHSDNDGGDLKILLEYLGYQVYLIKDIRVAIPEKEVVKETPKEENENTLDFTRKSESINSSPNKSKKTETLDCISYDSVNGKSPAITLSFEKDKQYKYFQSRREEYMDDEKLQVLTLFIYTGHGVKIKDNEESTYIVPVNWTKEHPYLIPESYLSSLFPGGENHFFFLGCSHIVKNSKSIIDKKIEYTKNIGKNYYYYAALRNKGVPIVTKLRNSIYCTILMNGLINCIKDKKYAFGELFPAARNEKRNQLRLEFVDNNKIKAKEKQLQDFMVKIFPSDLSDNMTLDTYPIENKALEIVKRDILRKMKEKIIISNMKNKMVSTIVGELSRNKVFLLLYWDDEYWPEKNQKETIVSQLIRGSLKDCEKVYTKLHLIVPMIKKIGVDNIVEIKVKMECEKFLSFYHTQIAQILKDMLEKHWGTSQGSFYVYLFFKKKDDDKLSKIEKLSKKYGFTLDVLTKEQFLSETKGSMLLIENDNQSKLKKVYFVEDVQDLNNEKELCEIKYDEVFPNPFVEEKIESEQDNEKKKDVSLTKPSISVKEHSIAYLSSYKHVFYWNNYLNKSPQEVISNNVIIEKVVCGVFGVFVLSKLGKWYAYGNNWNFVLGLKDTRKYSDLTLHPFLNNQKKVLRIESRKWFSFFCVENENGEKQLYVCGENKFLGVNKNSGVSGYPPIRIEKFSNDLKDIKTGDDHSFVMTEKENKIYSTGSNFYGQCALGKERDHEYEWKEVKYFRENGIKVKNIECGSCSSYFLTEKNEVYSCGKNSDGELGLNDDKKRCISTLIKHGIKNNIRKMFITDDDSAFFLCNNGELMACGDSSNKKLGVENDDYYVLIPTKVKIDLPKDDEIKQIIVLRDYHTVIVFESGKMKELTSTSFTKNSLVKTLKEIEEDELIMKENQSLFDEKKYEELSKLFKKLKERTNRRFLIRNLKEIENDKEMMKIIYENGDKFIYKMVEELYDFIEENQKKTRDGKIEPEIAKKFLSLIIKYYSSDQ